MLYDFLFFCPPEHNFKFLSQFYIQSNLLKFEIAYYNFFLSFYCELLATISLKHTYNYIEIN